MAALEPYTNTYTDVADSIMDADDLVAEFWRVAYFLALWGEGVEAIGRKDEYTLYIEEIEGQLAEILPARGLIQRLEVSYDTEQFEVSIQPHTVGAPFRVYIVIRCANPNTRFTVSAPAGESHVFSVQRTQQEFQSTAERFMPSQVIADGWYTATVIVTYGSEKGVKVIVHSANPEEEVVDFNDVLSTRPV